jgi:hypothetical protein
MNTVDQRLQETYQFLADVFGASAEDFATAAMLPDPPPDLPEGVIPKMSGVISLKNEPEFWADAPWRVEPDQAHIPVSFHVRDADIKPPGNGPWRLDMLRVEQSLNDGTWYKLASILPSSVPDVDDQGMSTRSFWVHGTQIPLAALQEIDPGDTAHLRAVFSGSFPPHEKAEEVEIHLEVLLGEQALPLSRAAGGAGARHWFYGDTHYHSAYTNDVKEFGGAIAEARRAGRAIGLDWLVITDHSCDLDEVDPGHGHDTRWDRLKAELSEPGISDGRFRFILGEEISLYGQDEEPVHMLAIGALDQMVEGGFLPNDGGGFKAELAKKALTRILQASVGYPSGIPERLFGQIHSLDDVLDMLPENTLTFAAHPYDVAQIPPAKWSEAALAHPKLTGHEFWNGRWRSSAGLTFHPFSRAAWANQDKAAKKDRARIRELKRQAKEGWDPHLQAGVEEWLAGEELPARRPVFIAGSDAHCDFNYHVGMAWDYRKLDTNDNALGRVRTIAYVPDHGADTVPEVDTILAALKKGACVVTDGPIIEFWVEQNDTLATMGEVLEVSGLGPVELKIVPHTTPEFGQVEQVEIVTYFAGQRKKDPRRTTLEAGTSTEVRLDGLQGYVRVECQTTGARDEGFCCFSNPIWVKATDGKKRRMLLSFA